MQAWSRMRLDRELACDALALEQTRETENTSYGQTIIKLIESFSRPAMAPGMVGILEHKNQIKRRITMIAKFKKTNNWPVLAATAWAALALVTLTDAQTSRGTGGGSSDSSSSTEGPPRIVSTSPQVGETDVNPALTEITITFDRDMAGGFSWTGGPPDFPPSPEGAKAKWQNKNGAKDVNPSLREIRVTFSVSMGEGCSWTGGGEQFPAIPAGKKPSWSEDHRTCVLPVELKPGREYHLGLNSPSYKNFQSTGGVPLEPVHYTFKTTE